MCNHGLLMSFLFVEYPPKFKMFNTSGWRVQVTVLLLNRHTKKRIVENGGPGRDPVPLVSHLAMFFSSRRAASR